MEYRSFGLSDKGRIRNTNQDSFLINETENIFVVADGLGGQTSGDIASKMAVKLFEKGIIRLRNKEVPSSVNRMNDLSVEQRKLLATALYCNKKIISRCRENPSLEGMGATLLGMCLEDNRLVAINIGDCRLYRIRDNTIKQLTKDQTLVAEEKRMGKISDEEARKHPKRHILSNAIGHITNSSKVDILKKSIIEKDIYLICSDGLYNMLDDSQILKIIRDNSGRSLYQMGISLVIKANTAGGTDNITVVIISFD